jgi:phenylacetate-coenzyme A ligase PaaK-like adenylate-forming protein
MAIAFDVWRAGRQETALHRKQHQRLASLVEHARQRSRYYAELYASLGSAHPSLQRLPVVQKPDLMARFNDWVTDPQVTRAAVERFAADPNNIGGSFLGKYLVFTTSGTTGFPALLLQDELTMAVLEAFSVVRVAPKMINRQITAAVLRGGGRTAAVWATGRAFGGASLVSRQIRQRPSRAKRIRLFSALTPVEQLVDQLNEFQPVMLSGYATALALLAREQQAGRLAIQPAVINNGGETLTAEARALIETAFRAKVFNGYGCSEMLMIAYDCGHGSMHVHADWVILEPVDEHFRPVPAGVPSATVLLTNLANHVQPVIRYDLGDSVLMALEQCACGSRLPAMEVIGRTNELLTFATAGGDIVELLPLPLVTLAEGAPGVRGVQLVQDGPSALTVRLEVMPRFAPTEVWADIEGRLRAYLAAHHLGSVRLALAAEPPQRMSGSGKLRQVISHPSRHG